MELRCALVLLAQIGIVISSPYGYGPRAGAKADASAVAGAYGGAGALPIDVPKGEGGYSGSFSKSFSSSSASSSSSSSASSSSFSYSGSGESLSGTGCGSDACKLGIKGAGGQGYSGSGSDSHGQGSIGTGGQYNNDASGSNNEPKTDCGSGNCQGSKGSGSSNAYSGANAVASAGAGIQTGTTYSKDKNQLTKPACEGLDCGLRGNSDADSDSKLECLSGNCDNKPHSQVVDGKCASGQCGPYTQTGSPSNEYGSNDIHIPTSSTGQLNAKTNYGSHGQSSVKHSDSNCKYGNNCGTQPATNPSYIPEYPPCSSPDCNNYGKGPSSTPDNQGNVNKPAVILTAPKDNTECSTPNCQSASSQANPNGYSTPNNGFPNQNTFTNAPNSPCIGGSCQSGYTKAPYSTNSVSPYPSSQLPNGPSKCAFGNCNTYTSIQSPIGYGGSPQFTPLTPSAPICAPGSPNCIARPQQFGCPVGTPNCNNNLASKPTLGHHVPLTPSGLICTPGSPYCNAGQQSECPPGLPNCNNNLVPKSTPGQQTPPRPASICAGPPGSPCNDAFIANKQPVSHFPLSPKCPPGSPFCNSETVPSSIPPNNQGGTYGARPYSPLPPGSITFPSSPARGSYSHTGSLPSAGYQPGYTSSSSYTPSNLPSYNTPTDGGCNLPSCGGAGIVPAVVTAGANAESKPIGESEESDKLPPYHGGFGGPSGILKPNEYKASSLPLTSSKPPGASSPVCASGKCGPHSSSYGSHPGLQATAEVGANPDTVGPSGKPEATYCTSGNCGSSLNASPTYGSSAGSQLIAGAGDNAGFGGPTGILKPNEFTVPTTTYNKPASLGAPAKPVCTTGNCGTASSPSYSNGISGSQATASASASANAVAYTGGFGGPPGVLKPYDGGKVDGKPGGVHGLHQGSYTNNGVGSHQGSYSNNGVGSHQGSYSNNGVGSDQGSYSNNGVGSHQGSLTKNGLGSHQGSYSNNGLSSQQGSYLNNGAGTNTVQSASLAQANAVAGTNTGAYGQNGCGGGCGGGSYGGYRGSNYGSSDSLGLSKSGLEGLNGAVSGANAKSLSGGIGSGGYGGSFASSSASAHASSGAAVKGSYGKR